VFCELRQHELRRKSLPRTPLNRLCWTHVLRRSILQCRVGDHVSAKEQKRAERRAQREAYRRWKQHPPLTRE
jgi:hypothetical protein